jgi:hypothetical protein
MAMLIDLKADGLITDYPDRGLAVLAEKAEASLAPSLPPHSNREARTH